MRRRTLRVIAMLSLLPLTTLAAAWAASRTSTHLLARADDEGNCVLLTAGVDGVDLIVASGWPDPRPLSWESAGDAVLRAGFRPRDAYRVLGVTVADGRAELYTLAGAAPGDPYLAPAAAASPLYIASAGPSWSVRAPFGPLFLASLAPLVWLPRWTFRRLRAGRRRRAGRCLACGYDVRVATGDRCPECGAPVR